MTKERLAMFNSKRLCPFCKGCFAALVVVLILGCTVGPNYKRPPVTVPGDYRGVAPDAHETSASLGDEKWWAVSPR